MSNTEEKQKLNLKTDSLISFDIFDTLVTRRVATPVGIFALMQEYLCKNNIFDDFFNKNFYQIRIGAEELARNIAINKMNSSEITFGEIYNLIQENYELSNSQIEYLKELELTTEVNNIVPIQKNISLLKKYVQSDIRVVLISDMYFSSSQLKRILSHIDPIFTNIDIYVSSEFACSKSDSKLYRIVQQRENISFLKWIHHGDNKGADIKSAQRFGIKTKYLPAESLMPYEQKLLLPNPCNVDYQIIFGSARLARIEGIDKNIDTYNFGCSFGGPILYNYVDFVINNALKKGVKTLYFIARDGYIPKLIADIIIKNKNLNLKTKYIYGSRQAWRVPSETNYGDIIDWIFSEYKNRLNLDLLCYRLGLDTEEFAKLLKIKHNKQVFSKHQREALFDKFKTDNVIKNKVLNANQERLLLLQEYLKQEIDLEAETTIYFVDLFGSGRTQDVLAGILNSIKPCKIFTFYVTNEIFKNTTNSKIISYFTTQKYLRHDIELLSKTPEGQTIGYKEENNKVIPITETVNSKTMIEWGFNEYIKGIDNFVNIIIKTEFVNNCSSNTILLYCHYFDYIKDNIDFTTARVMGDIPYTIVGSEKKCKVSAQKLPLLKVITDFLAGKSNSIEFPNISYARSSLLSRYLQDIIKECPTLQKFLLNVYVHKKNREAYIRILGIKISFNNLYRSWLLNE